MARDYIKGVLHDRIQDAVKDYKKTRDLNAFAWAMMTAPGHVGNLYIAKHWVDQFIKPKGGTNGR